ncbi:MAG: glycerol kinase GlpK [Treponema sp.]|nr:glycerol kinase GlpK [Treponema sp.]
MQQFILALDEGTTSCRAVVFDKRCKMVAVEQKEFTQFYPKPGWVEHDAQEIFDTQMATINAALQKAGISKADAGQKVAALGITNQRETLVMWDRQTGKPVCPAIVWQCRRTAQIADDLVTQGYGEKIRAATGLIPDAYFTGTKIKWLLENLPGLRARCEAGEVLAGTIDSWLIWKLSGGKAHVTDYTNASRTMLFNIHALEWDKELLHLLNIPQKILPRVVDSSGVYATTDKDVCGFEIPIASAIGDQQSALFGQGCFKPGEAKNTYGTGCFLLMNTGSKAYLSKNKLLTTIAIGLGGKVEYALEGSIFMGGAVVKWLRDELNIISASKECDGLAATVPDSNGAILVPAFTGLGAPYWDPYARGILVGLTRGTNKAHICRAALDAIAFQVTDSLKCMEDDSGIKISALKVDGGASASNILMQIQADYLNAKVIRPQNTETTVTGAAFLAGLAVGFWESKEEILSFWKADREFVPAMEDAARQKALAGWKKAVVRAQKWTSGE